MPAEMGDDPVAWDTMQKELSELKMLRGWAVKSLK